MKLGCDPELITDPSVVWRSRPEQTPPTVSLTVSSGHLRRGWDNPASQPSVARTVAPGDDQARRQKEKKVGNKTEHRKLKSGQDTGGDRQDDG